MDANIVVIAPDSERIARVTARDTAVQMPFRARMRRKSIRARPPRRADLRRRKHGDLHICAATQKGSTSGSSSRPGCRLPPVEAPGGARAKQGTAYLRASWEAGLASARMGKLRRLFPNFRGG